MRHDRSPCGAGASARLAVMLARDQIAEGETFVHESLIGAEFIGRIRGLATVGDRPAVLPTITGSAWITAFRIVPAATSILGRTWLRRAHRACSLAWPSPSGPLER